MDLKKRLASLDRMTRRPQSATPEVREFSAGAAEEMATGLLGLETEATALGPCFFKDYRENLPLPAEPLPDFTGFLSRPGADIPGVSDILFLDTETTGLAGGTGTIAFLVGLSWWSAAQFHTRQYFLCGPAGEAALLQQLHKIASGFKAVATFNGASFDLPLLRTRALMNRLDHPWDHLHGWDLLVPARRLWGRQLDNCRQQTVESAVCGLGRGEQDIEGHLIPQTWFDFLQQGRPGGLVKVLYHNQRDMVGMGSIFLEMVALARRLNGAGPDREDDWHAAWALGRIAEARGDRALSGLWLTHACLAARQHCPAAFAEGRFVADALRILKRGGDWRLVENVIAWALDCGQNEWWLHREAAILYEHRLVDLERARGHALAAGDEHRLLRVLGKLKLSRKESP